MDFADTVNESMEQYDKQVHAYRFNIPSGIAGECVDCGDDVPRLIGNKCPQCIDAILKRKIR